MQQNSEFLTDPPWKLLRGLGVQRGKARRYQCLAEQKPPSLVAVHSSRHGPTSRKLMMSMQVNVSSRQFTN